MKFSAFALSLLLGLAVLAAGCNTFERRAREKAAVFSTLDSATRARLKSGLIQLGDAADLVYLALGEPDETRDQVAAEGSAVVWIYNTRWQEYRGESVVGYHPITTTDPKTGTPNVLYEPVERSVYQDREEERLRVTFKDGKVTVIERPKE